VVSELINRLRNDKGNALFVYFSDHGEEVYDTPGKPFSGRNEGAPTPAMYTVPFLTWASADFKASHNMAQWRSSVDRPFSSADFIYTLCDMMGINFKRMDYTRSLISDQFVQHSRWIGDPSSPATLKEYDKMGWESPLVKPFLVADKNDLTVDNQL
jgi:heptose-I-phosphate ethanolaminephosphotransferase